MTTIETMTLAEVEERIAELSAHRELVATNDGTHAMPADTHTWKRYELVSTIYPGTTTYVDNPRALERGEGHERVFGGAYQRVREMRDELRALRERVRREGE